MTHSSRRPTATSAGHQRTAAVILVCFFASGMSGLIYQVIWVRELILVFGATTFAASTVLTAFMGGLALGSFYFGRRSDKTQRPLRLYGWLEIGIGSYGLSVPLIFTLLPAIYHPMFEQIGHSFFTLSLFRFALVAVVLIIPTALMGATLPVLASYYARESKLIGLRVGLLYSLNTFGAVLGAALSGFVLIPTFGMRATTAVAASINILLGIVALLLDRRSAYRVSDAERTGERDAKSARKRIRWLTGSQVEAVSRRDVIVTLVVFALSGFIALCYEVIWSRVLALIIGSSVYAFTIMLTTFLIGLAAGASLASRFADRIKRPILTFALIEVGIGLTSFAGAYLFTELPFIFVQLYRWTAGSAVAVLLVSRFAVASLVIIAPTVLLGGLFPLVVRIVYGQQSGAGGASPSHGDRSLGRTVGNAYSINTIGAIAGAFLSGFVLIPLIGLQGSLILCVALNFVIAGSVLAVRKERGLRSAGLVLAIGLVLLVVSFRPPWDVAVMSSAVYRYAPSMAKMSRPEFYEYFKQGNQGEAVFYEEGITATVVVQQQAGGRVLKVNGKPDASTGIDLPTQVLIGGLPLLVREKTDDVLVIGLGSGVTLGSVEQFPVKSVTCVELEPAVIKASHHFDDLNNRPLEDPRLRLIANDGRNYLDTTNRKFDVIVSEPSNPWLTGVANLFTLEYFKRGADRLKDDGVFSQWLQIYEMDTEDVRTLVATFREAFPHTILFRGSGSDLMLLGSKKPLQLDLAIIEKHLHEEKQAAEFGRIEITTAADILSYFYFGIEGVARFTRGATLNTDDNALIEFRAPRRVGTVEETVDANLKQLLACAKEYGRPFPVAGSEDSSAVVALPGTDPHKTAQVLLDAALCAIRRDDAVRGEQFALFSLELLESAQGYSILGEISNSRDEDEQALEYWARALRLEPNHYFTHIDLGKYYLAKQDIGRAVEYLDKAIQLDPSKARGRHLRGLAYQAVGDYGHANREYVEALADADYGRKVKPFYLNFGTSLFAAGHYEEAAKMLEEYTRLAPNDGEGYYQLGAAYEVSAERSLNESYTYRAIDALKRALGLRPNHPMSHYYLSKAYRRIGKYEEAETEFDLYERYLAK